MTIQYMDGSFSEIMEADEAIEKFSLEWKKGLPVKNLFLGEKKEIENTKRLQLLEQEIQTLKEKIKEISPVKTFLIIPTQQEINFIGGKNG